MRNKMRDRYLEAELDALEVTDPEVKAARERLNRAISLIGERRIHPVPCRDLTCIWHHPPAD